ncbi:MAG: cupredoxin domain-containing protein [Actinomycetota bacterium]
MTRGRLAGRLSALALLVAILPPGLSLASPAEVSVSDNSFSPKSERVLVGERVVWSRASGSSNAHNVREDGKLFRNGDPTTGPIDFGVVFSAGRFRYRCEVHGGGGMEGVIEVPVKLLPDPQGSAFTARWAKSRTETGQIFDAQYRIGTSGTWKSWLSNTRELMAIFGAKDKPVGVERKTTYQIRARSGRGTTNSLWSPPVSFTP